MKQEQRIEILDVVRGIALLGVLLVSVNSFGRPEIYRNEYDFSNEGTGINYYVWWIITGGFDGAMRALFSILFGTSVVLLLYRLEKKSGSLSVSPADIYFRRTLLLLCFAMVDGFILLWYSDILFSYAICGMFIFPFRHLNSKYLLIIGFFLLTIAGLQSTSGIYKSKNLREKGEKVLLMESQGIKLDANQVEIKNKWEAFLVSQSSKKEEAEAEKENLLKNYISIAKYNAKRTIYAQSQYFYKEGFLDVIPLFFIGMALFKLKILTGERSRKFYWMMTIAGIGIGSALAYYMLNGYINAEFDKSRYADYLIADFYQAKRVFLALGYMGIIMLVYKYGLAAGLYKVLAKVGQMTLTNYMLQAAICAVIFYGFGFNLFGSLERYQLYYVVLGVWIFLILFSNIWMKYFRYGPLEWIWRCLTYWKIQPLRR